MENQPIDAIAPIPVSEVPSEYIVSKGDTLSEIAARGGEDLDRLMDFNNLKNSNIFVGQKIRFPVGDYEIPNEIYIIKKGDTLSEIAQRFRISQGRLKYMNNSISDKIVVGQKLKIPKEQSNTFKRSYLVKYGDTLSEIAQKYNTTTGELMFQNKLLKPDITVGQKLLIP